MGAFLRLQWEGRGVFCARTTFDAKRFIQEAFIRELRAQWCDIIHIYKGRLYSCQKSQVKTTPVQTPCGMWSLKITLIPKSIVNNSLVELTYIIKDALNLYFIVIYVSKKALSDTILLLFNVSVQSLPLSIRIKLPISCLLKSWSLLLSLFIK